MKFTGTNIGGTQGGRKKYLGLDLSGRRDKFTFLGVKYIWGFQPDACKCLNCVLTLPPFPYSVFKLTKGNADDFSTYVH